MQQKISRLFWLSLEIKKCIWSREGTILMISVLIAAASYGSKPKLTTFFIWKKEVLTREFFPVEIDIISKIYSCSCSYLAKILLL